MQILLDLVNQLQDFCSERTDLRQFECIKINGEPSLNTCPHYISFAGLFWGFL